MVLKGSGSGYFSGYELHDSFIRLPGYPAKHHGSEDQEEDKQEAAEDYYDCGYFSSYEL